MSMTLKEAIKHAEAQAIRNEKEAKRNHEHGGTYYDVEAQACSICAEEHRQLAEWLRELKERRKQPEIIFCKDCRFSIPVGCAIFCKSWSRYTAHKGYCHQGAERRTDENN